MSFPARAALALALGVAMASPIANAAKFQILHTFTGGKDGATPSGWVAFSPSGTLYSTTYSGGNYLCGCGVVFQLDTATRKLTTLYEFNNGTDGEDPSAGLVLDKGGALYGTTSKAGQDSAGNVFKLVPGTKQLTTLYAFPGGQNAGPLAGVVFDKAGALYGTTNLGGPYSAGTVFKLDPATGKLTKLHVFTYENDGGAVQAGLVFDRKGILYGLTGGGGDAGSGYGTLFKLDPATKVLTTLYTFTGGSDGGGPSASLAFGPGGRLYGTTTSGGSNACNYGCGTLFEFDLTAGKLTTLHGFTGGADGGRSFATPVFDKAGTLYGTTSGGENYGKGTVFKYDRTTGKLTTLHAFTGGPDGANPFAGVVFDKTGALYGTAVYGGRDGYGTVYKLTP